MMCRTHTVTPIAIESSATVSEPPSARFDVATLSSVPTWKIT